METNRDHGPGDVTTTDTTASRGVAGRRIATVLVATIATITVYSLARYAFDVDVRTTTGDAETAVLLPSVIVATLVCGLLGWALLAILERVTGKARRIFVIVALVVLVGSMLGPTAGVTASAQLTLALLHLTAALVLVPGLARTARKG